MEPTAIEQTGTVDHEKGLRGLDCDDNGTQSERQKRTLVSVRDFGRGKGGACANFKIGGSG